MKERFFACRHCGKMIAVIAEEGTPTVCCQEEMTELIPNTVEASKEKHLPVVTVEGNRVRVNVGSAPHPMAPEHHIGWILLRTTHKSQRHDLAAGDEPTADFLLSEGEKAEAVYAYCNLHGLWLTEI